MPEDYNGYTISEQGGHKFVVTKADDPDFGVTIFHWPHDARAWIDALPAAKAKAEKESKAAKRRPPAEEEEDEPPKHHRSKKNDTAD